MALSVKRIERIKEPGRYRDRKNLFLQVTESGGKSWLFKYQFRGRPREMGLGSYQYVTLEDARDLAEKNQKLLRGKDPIDPLAERKAERDAEALKDAKTKTFEMAATEYFNGHAAQWTNAHYHGKFLSSLKMYAFPHIGDLSVAAIDTGLVLKVIEPIWLTKPDTANRVRGRIENVLGWATVRGFRSGDNPARWAGHLKEALPAKTRVTKHQPALPYAEVPAFVAALADQRGDVNSKALEFLILTAARSGEVIGARWSEIDFDNKLWVIPPERMKEKKPHRVPLVDRAIQILKELPREGDFVFIGSRKNMPLGKNSFLKLIWAIGRDDITVHGFRSSFRDWAGETTAFPADICEAALSHAVGGKVQITYQRGDLLEKRRKLMEAWAAFVKLPKRTATVTPIRKQRGA
jgi:integrase